MTGNALEADVLYVVHWLTLSGLPYSVAPSLAYTMVLVQAVSHLDPSSARIFP
jgi:hypothetical protein